MQGHTARPAPRLLSCSMLCCAMHVVLCCAHLGLHDEHRLAQRGVCSGTGEQQGCGSAMVRWDGAPQCKPAAGARGSHTGRRVHTGPARPWRRAWALGACVARPQGRPSLPHSLCPRSCSSWAVSSDSRWVCWVRSRRRLSASARTCRRGVGIEAGRERLMQRAGGSAPSGEAGAEGPVAQTAGRRAGRGRRSLALRSRVAAREQRAAHRLHAGAHLCRLVCALGAVIVKLRRAGMGGSGARRRCEEGVAACTRMRGPS